MEENKSNDFDPNQEEEEVIDDKLNCNEHINAINLKLAKGIGLLAKIRHFVPKTVLRSLYYAFINPHIDYNLLNWALTSQTNLILLISI